ncbi:MAG TPA: hypothetical protein VGN34_19850 [Ktedonobacteraceae bacterium]|jgi:hypothetical protein
MNKYEEQLTMQLGMVKYENHILTIMLDDIPHVLNTRDAMRLIRVLQALEKPVVEDIRNAT